MFVLETWGLFVLPAAGGGAGAGGAMPTLALDVTAATEFRLAKLGNVLNGGGGGGGGAGMCTVVAACVSWELKKERY